MRAIIKFLPYSRTYQGKGLRMIRQGCGDFPRKAGCFSASLVIAVPSSNRMGPS
ncbi:hypothetical protein DES44_2911 [Roseateles depolymerans]|uniref:Uncharacterized protein n=1 Tax=Roseateles depolymerans TaxID=76731 RepID=A0A0U3MDK8_9BURK|nr:hypothetical protein RD2015_1070 [Roseateles depolymerans]REG14416.1 hypothetical protein DES44_2911 [Roseateles depolymerans]